MAKWLYLIFVSLLSKFPNVITWHFFLISVGGKKKVIFAHKGKSNTSFVTVKGLLLFVWTHNINILFSFFPKTNRMRYLPSWS